MKYLYDTKIFIDYFADEEEVAVLFSEDFLTQHEVIVSTIVKIELLCYSGLSSEEDRVIRDVLEQFEIIRIPPEIEEKTIALRKNYAIKLPDAIIAATALCQEACLVTRNTDDFQNIPDLSLYNPFDSLGSDGETG